jgi:hypothetical protein
MNINEKELCKQIKKSVTMIWSVVDGTHYFTNRHWAVKYDDLPRYVLVTLFSMFAVVPQEGESLSVRKGEEASRFGANIKKAFDDQSSITNKGEVTPFLKLYDTYNLRVIKVGNEPAYVNNDYMKIIKDVENSNPVTLGTKSAISFNDNTVILLPYRLSNDREDGIVKELLAS